MALWGRLDNAPNAPKFINLSAYPAGTSLVLVDSNEADQAANKAKGFGSPGWYLYRTWTDANGKTRNHTEQLVAFSHNVTFAVAGDAADDAILKDLTILYTTQPTNQSVSSGAVATFAAVTNPSAGVTYQWQRSTDAGVTFADVANGGGYAGVTTVSLAITTTLGMTGYKFRLVATKTAGDAAPAASNVVTLTVA